MKKLNLVMAAVSSLVIGVSAYAVPGSEVGQVKIYTHLGSRVTADIASQPDKEGKGIANPYKFVCTQSGTCDSIYHAVNSTGKYDYKDTGSFPNIITFNVKSAGGSHASSMGEFQVNLNDAPNIAKQVKLGKAGGGSVLLTGDSYIRPAADCIEATPVGKVDGRIQLCPGLPE